MLVTLINPWLWGQPENSAQTTVIDNLETTYIKMLATEPETYCPQHKEDWYNWLAKHHATKESVWVIFYNKKSGKENITWSNAVDAALCFGWIDSKKQTIDAHSYRQFYSKRKPASTWSKINKEKVKLLIANKQMAAAGFKSIEVAKQNGWWTILDEAEALIIPDDLELAFTKYPKARAYFTSLSKSARKGMLFWIVLARLPETRQKRINEIAIQAGKEQKPKQFR